MSWELVSFLILAAVLIGGFAWYERSRPPAQVVALVAALAALAIAGRIAFAAFPNVKPTTDIIVLAGFALGAAPGFAVGALTAVVSNFWFGQGPWTPWQMAGWGLCGVLGALLALGFRNAGRLTLAVTCGFAGIAYGALMNFSLMATYGGELSWERFGVISARAIPFDAAHVVANIALALVAGPAIVRMLTRFRRRFEWERGGGAPLPPDAPEPPGRGGLRKLRPALKGGGLAAVLVVLLAALVPSPAQAAGEQSAVKWLRAAQNADGGFGASPDDDSGPEMTAWAMLGLEAAGVNPYDLARGKHTPVSYLRARVDELRSPGDLARTILALLGTGADPRDFGGRNLVAALHSHRRANGSYLGWPNSTAFAVIALRAADSPGGTGESMDWLRKVQNEDGGWGIEVGTRSDAESTGAVLQALSPGSKAAQRALKYLREAQQSNGGYRVGGSGAINTQATAWAVQGILAVGADPSSFKRGGKTPLGYIAANQAPDGHYRYSKQSDQTPVWVNGQVLVAVAGKFFPVAAPARAPRPKPKPSPRTGGAAAPAPGQAASPAPESEPLPVPPPSSGAAGSGSAASPPAIPPGADEVPPGATPPPGEGPGQADGGLAPEAISPDAVPEPLATEAAAAGDGEDSGTSVAGSIVFGLLAGGLLFGLGLLGRKGWMRWRYGL